MSNNLERNPKSLLKYVKTKTRFYEQVACVINLWMIYVYTLPSSCENQIFHCRQRLGTK